MGRGALRLRYVQAFVDHQGRGRYYFRKRGHKLVPLPGLLGSAEFMTAYQEALGGERLPVASTKTKPGTMKALAVSYYTSAAFRSLRTSTQYERRGTIDRFCREHGDKDAARLERKHVKAMVDALVDKPGAAGNLRKALRELMKHAIEIGLRSDNPAREIKLPRSTSDGHHTWTEDEIEAFEAAHPAGSRERLAMALL